jgi:membrane protease YdiL (CAAX protease family)
MLGWGASFVLSAAVVFPLLLIANGVDPRSFDASEQSKYLLAIQAIETAETFLILWLLLRRFAPEMEGKDWFVMDPTRDPGSVEKGWLTWGLLGYVAAILGIGVTAVGVDLITHALDAAKQVNAADVADAANASASASAGGGVDLDLGGGGGGGWEDRASSAGGAGATTDAIAGAAGRPSSAPSAGGPSAGGPSSGSGPGTIDAVLPLLEGGEGRAGRLASVFAVTSFLAPLLEEVVFRGFLMASLTRWLPVPGAVLFSSVAFAGAHFAPRDFPQLCALGMVLGFSYARTRNLLTPMFIHATWNGGVLAIVAALVATGNQDLIPGFE